MCIIYWKQLTWAMHAAKLAQTLLQHLRFLVMWNLSFPYTYIWLNYFSTSYPVQIIVSLDFALSPFLMCPIVLIYNVHQLSIYSTILDYCLPCSAIIVQQLPLQTTNNCAFLPAYCCQQISLLFTVPQICLFFLGHLSNKQFSHWEQKEWIFLQHL